MRVLVAEDAMTVQAALRKALTEWGYDVVYTADGRQALELLLQPDPPSVAILDWMMPGMDGVDVCRELRRLAPDHPVYVLLLTGRDSSADVVTGLDAGADDYVTKPFRPEELRARVRAGARLMELQRALVDNLHALDDSRKLIRRSEEHYRTLVEGAPTGIISIDANGVIQSVNNAFTGMLGGSAESLIGKPLRELWTGQPAQTVVDYALTTVMAGERAECTAEFRRSDGHRAYWEMVFSPFTADSDELTGAVCMVVDITTRHQAEEALRDSELWFRTIGDAAQDAIVAVGPTGSITYCNRAAERVLSYNTYEMMGMPAYLLFTTDPESDIAYQMTVEWRDTGEGRRVGDTFELSCLTRSGTMLPAEVSVATARVKGSWHAIIVIRDITERQERENQRQELMRQLESMNKELRDFAFIVSHDLKAPLRAITSLSTWISQDYGDRLDEDGRQQLELMIQRVRRMNQLIDGVLEYSRVGRIRETPEPIDTGKLVSDVLDLIGPPAHIDIKCETPMPVVVYEPTRLLQLFQNLISNAIKYNDKEQGIIRIGCETWNETGEYHFYVSDNGPGIAEKDRERVFLIFQTLQARDEVESTGIGLTIVKKIVETCGGRVWIDDAPEGGARFHFTVRMSPDA